MFSSNVLHISIDFFPLNIEKQGLSGAGNLDKMQGILGEEPGDQRMNHTLKSTKVYSPRILCALLVYGKIVALFFFFF